MRRFLLALPQRTGLPEKRGPPGGNIGAHRKEDQQYENKETGRVIYNYNSRAHVENLARCALRLRTSGRRIGRAARGCGKTTRPTRGIQVSQIRLAASPRRLPRRAHVRAIGRGVRAPPPDRPGAQCGDITGRAPSSHTGAGLRLRRPADDRLATYRIGLGSHAPMEQ